MRGRFLILGALVLATGTVAAAANEQPICADRPGKSTPTCTVPRGHWQIETGLADWSQQEGAGERNILLVVGETTVEYGLTNRSDIELDFTPWQRSTSKAPGLEGRASGIGDVGLIYKYRLTAGQGPLQLAISPVIKIPTANHSLGNGKWEAGLLLPIDYGLGKTPFSLNLTPEVDWVADSDGRGHHVRMVQVASVGWQANDKLSLSAELWGQWDWDPSGMTRQASAGGSVAYLLSNDVQLDAGTNFGLNRATPDVEVYGGISVRF